MNPAVLWKPFIWIRRGAPLFCCLALTMVALMSVMYSLMPLRGRFLANHKMYYLGESATRFNITPYTAVGSVEIRPDITPSLCRRSHYPLRSLSGPSDYYTRPPTERAENFSNANVTFIFVPGHCATGIQSVNIFGEIQSQLRWKGFVARDYFMLDFSEEPTAASKDLIERQSDFLIRLVENITAEQKASPSQLVVFGSSLGGTVSVYAASKRPDLFSQTKAIITLSSPLDSLPLYTSYSVSEVYRQIHARSAQLPPLIQLYAGNNDFLVDAFNSRIDQYRTHEKLFVYVPTMRNVFFDVLHHVLPLSSLVGPQIGEIVSEYVVSHMNESITGFWREKTTLPVFNIDFESRMLAAEKLGNVPVIVLEKGLTLVREDELRGKQEIVYKINIASLKQGRPHVFITTVPAGKVRLLYEFPDGHEEEQEDYNFKFQVPSHYQAVPIPEKRVRQSSAIYIVLQNLRTFEAFQPRIAHVEKNETAAASCVVALREYSRCDAEVDCGDVMQGYKLDLAGGKECLHYSLNISSSVYPVELRSFSVKITARAKKEPLSRVKYTTLVLLNQDNIYTAVDFYSHLKQQESTAIELPCRTNSTQLALDLFGLDQSSYAYTVELTYNPIYPLQTLFRAHRFQVLNLSFALFLLLLFFQLRDYTEFRAHRDDAPKSPTFPVFRTLSAHAPVMVAIALGAATTQYMFEPWLRRYGMLGADYAVPGRSCGQHSPAYPLRKHTVRQIYVGRGTLANSLGLRRWKQGHIQRNALRKSCHLCRTLRIGTVLLSHVVLRNSVHDAAIQSIRHPDRNNPDAPSTKAGRKGGALPEIPCPQLCILDCVLRPHSIRLSDDNTQTACGIDHRR